MKKPFPYLLLRLGGISYDALQVFVFDEKIANDFYEKSNLLEAFKRNLNTYFNEKIKDTTNYQFKKIAKNIRNDVFNNRTISFEKLLKNELLDRETIDQLTEFQTLHQEYENLKSHFKKSLQTHLEKAQKSLQVLSNYSNLQNGLVLSSPALLSRISNYQQKTPYQFRKKELQTERALMQYLARIALKTSPFGTFNQISSIELVRETTFFENVQIANSTTHLRLNNYLFFYFKNLIIQDVGTRLSLRLQVNSTYQIADNQHVFLTNSNNVEAFQTVDFHPVIDFIVNAINETSLKYGELIHLLLENIEANEGDLQIFVQELYEIGLLEYDFGISGLQANWHLELIAFLEKMKRNSFIEKVLNELFKLEKAIQDYHRASPKDRLNILKIIHNDLSLLFQKEVTTTVNSVDFFKKDTTTDFHFTTSNLLFEDASANITGTINAELVNDFRKKLNSLTEYLDDLRGNLNGYKKVRACYEAEFDNQIQVNILTFYQKYANWQQQNIKDKTIENVQNERIKNWQNAFINQLQSKLSEEVINISLEDLKAIQGDFFNKKKTKKQLKVSAFVQLFKNEKTTELKGVVNAVFPAYGKYFSRFLHLLDDKITNEIQAQNASESTAFYAEIVDNSYFNANIHPPLMPFEIKTPNGNTTLSDTQLLSVNDIFIKKEKDKLILIHKQTGKQIMPYDLGFQSLDGRSELFKLLNAFSPARFVSLHYISDAILKAFDNEELVKIIPRITFEEDIIIQRKRWYLEQSILPFSKKNNETRIDYFIRLQEWRIKYDLPNKVFYTISPKELSNQINRSTDNHKPQYLDFRNPILVDAFGRNCSKVSIALLIEEFLPSSESLNRLGEERFVMEFLV